MADDTKPVAAPAPAPAKAPEPEKAPPVSLEDWHAAFIKRHAVQLKMPKHVGRQGRIFPEEVNDATLVSARCVLAHRVLHSLAPKDVEALKAAFAAAKVDSTHPDAFDMWALRLIDSQIPAGDGKGPSEGEFALSQVLEQHAHPKRVAEHRANVVAAASKPA